MSEVSSLLYDLNIEKVDMKDSREFFVEAVLEEIVNPKELQILCQWRLEGISLHELAEELEVTPLAVFMNTVSVRLRLTRFFESYQKPKKLKKSHVKFSGNIAGL